MINQPLTNEELIEIIEVTDNGYIMYNRKPKYESYEKVLSLFVHKSIYEAYIFHREEHLELTRRIGFYFNPLG
jgi:hypothetical protein